MRGRKKSARHVMDLCCGGKLFYYDKDCPEVLSQDVRQGWFEFPNNRILEIAPTILGDFTDMKDIPDGSYWTGYSLVVFDPPHLLRAGENSFLRAKYGVLPKAWKECIRKGFDNGFRVLRKNGVLLFKWSDVQIPHVDVLELSPYRPLLGDKRGTTRWTVFIKAECLKKEEENHE
nr:MAG TPA: putative modification methylase [Caudoviricetes sp.]